jgi:hypothetical protein
MKSKLLPIGSVVLLEGGTKKVMITGYYSKPVGSDRMYDYNGCVFPEGLMETIYCLFDKNQIRKTLHVGYESEKYEEYMKELNAMITGVSGKTEKDSANVTITRRRKPKAPTKPVSSSEFKAKYVVEMKQRGV